MLAMEEHRKKGREGLFFNHHQLGLATKRSHQIGGNGVGGEASTVVVVELYTTGSFPSPLLYGPSTLWTSGKVSENESGSPLCTFF